MQQCKQLLSTAASSLLFLGLPKSSSFMLRHGNSYLRRKNHPPPPPPPSVQTATRRCSEHRQAKHHVRHQQKKTEGCYRFEFPLSSAPKCASWTHFVGDLGTSPLYHGVNKQQFGQKTREIGGEGDLHSANLPVFQRGQGLGGYFTHFFPPKPPVHHYSDDLRFSSTEIPSVPPRSSHSPAKPAEVVPGTSSWHHR